MECLSGLDHALGVPKVKSCLDKDQAYPRIVGGPCSGGAEETGLGETVTGGRVVAVNGVATGTGNIKALRLDGEVVVFANVRPHKHLDETVHPSNDVPYQKTGCKGITGCSTCATHILPW